MEVPTKIQQLKACLSVFRDVQLFIAVFESRVNIFTEVRNKGFIDLHNEPSQRVERGHGDGCFAGNLGDHVAPLEFPSVHHQQLSGVSRADSRLLLCLL